MLSRKLKYYAYRLAPRTAAALHRYFLGRRRRQPLPSVAPALALPIRALEEAKALRERCTGRESPEALVDLVFRYPCIAPSQQRSEIIRLLKLVQRSQPRVICEIGSASGGTLFLFSHVAHPEARLLSIDIHMDDDVVEKFGNLVAPGQQLLCLPADSHDEGTLQRFREWLDGDAVDFLFIDGDHSLEGVAEDHRMYAPHVRPGGVVAFHDIVPDFKTRYGIDTGTYAGGVPQFWNSIKREAGRTQEFVDHRLQDGCGIGVIELPAGAASEDATVARADG